MYELTLVHPAETSDLLGPSYSASNLIFSLLLVLVLILIVIEVEELDSRMPIVGPLWLLTVSSAGVWVKDTIPLHGRNPAG